MATADSVKEKLQGIITKSNNTTGRNDNNVDSAVDALIDGFGKGGGITPTGTKNITTNGEHDVASYAKANVNVPVPSGYIKPIGTKTITENGTHDITNYASAEVAVPVPTQNIYTIPITVSTALGAGTNKNQTILSNHDFVKSHYTDDNFFAVWIPVNATTAVDSGVVGMVFHANRALITAKNTVYGIFLRSTGATASPSFMANTAKLSGSGYNVSLRANSSGDIKLYVASAYTVLAGDYLLVFGMME